MLKETLSELVCAAFSGIWIVTHEPEEAVREILRLSQEKQWSTVLWSVSEGFQSAGQTLEQPHDPLSAARYLVGTGSTGSTTHLLVLRNFHRFLGNPEIAQTLAHRLHVGKAERRFVVIVAPLVQIPVELEKQFVVIDHELPNRQQLAVIAEDLNGGPLPDLNHSRVLDAASGLTRDEAEGAFALSLARHGEIAPSTVFELKAKSLARSGLVRVHKGTESFQDLGGLEALKSFASRALQASGSVPARGIVLLSVPGCGKSAFAKALGNEAGRPMLHLDIGTLMGSLVGQSETNIRQALKIAEAMSPCVLFIDEVEKAFSAVGGQGDSGVTTRVFGTLLTWLADKTSDVFVVVTANDISKLPSEFTRAERFDGVFFIDLPDRKEKDGVWGLAKARFGLPTASDHPSDADWTGAEITSCCRLAALLKVSLKEAANFVVPVAKTARESVESLRQWAQGRCLSANQPGIYQGKMTKSSAARRSVSETAPSN